MRSGFNLALSSKAYGFVLDLQIGVFEGSGPSWIHEALAAIDILAGSRMRK